MSLNLTLLVIPGPGPLTSVFFPLAGVGSPLFFSPSHYRNQREAEQTTDFSPFVIFQPTVLLQTDQQVQRRIENASMMMESKVVRATDDDNNSGENKPFQHLCSILKSIVGKIFPQIQSKLLILMDFWGFFCWGNTFHSLNSSFWRAFERFSA